MPKADPPLADLLSLSERKMEIKRVGVVGGGQMGGGIAQAVATAGLDVCLVEVKDELIKKAMEGISWGLDKFIKKGKLKQEEKEKIIKRIRCTLRLEDLKDTDLVIEAVPEKEALKLEIFRRLDALCPPRVIFASNTSSIPITELASATKRPEKFIGIHFMNPAPVMELVEIVRGECTSEETLEVVRGFCKCLGKTPIEVKDSPGFVVNRIMAPMINEAIYLFMEGVASLEDIDKAMTLGARHPMGPLALADFVGLDTCLAIMETLYKELGDPKYKPCPLLKRYVEEGKLGKKSGIGFYKYT